MKNKEGEPAKKIGRPSLYNPKIAQDICKLIGTTSKSLKNLCKENPHWPTMSTIFLWRINVPEFSELYTKARINRVEVYVDEIADIADDSSNDDLETDAGKWAQNTEWLNRSRLRIDTRKWYASKLAPKLYGDKLQTELTGKDGAALQVETYQKETNDLINERIAEMLTEKKSKA